MARDDPKRFDELAGVANTPVTEANLPARIKVSQDKAINCELMIR